jgi:hypothetical protein
VNLGWSGVVLIVLVLVALTVTAPFRDVTRRRLERFALRQALPITVDNGMQVIRYLATTRRWRGLGLLVAVLVQVAYEATLDRGYTPHVTGGAFFAGWFVGAVVAEWRIAGVPVGEHRAASLARRRLTGYVARPALALVAVAWSAVVSVELLVAADVLPRRPDARWAPWLELGLTVVSGAAIVLAARRVLTRPQPLAAPDVLAADDALRSRSLYVLVGSALALGGYLGAQIIVASGFQGPGTTYELAENLELLGALVLPIAGFLLARSPRRRPVRRPAVPVAA